MMTPAFATFLARTPARSAMHWLHQLGGPGLVLVGILDASFIPMPGSVDVFTIALAAGNRPWWWYYAIMATVGAVAGAYFTYRIGQKGGKEALEKRFPKPKLEKVYKKFERGGFGTLFVAALMPPPVPLVPFVVAAGALEYPSRKFLTAIGSGRAIRYFLLAYLASIYGREIIGWTRKYYQPILWTFVGLVVMGGIAAAIYFWRRKQQSKKQQVAFRNDLAA